MNIGINGFGRIGRAIFRLISKNKDINVSVINDINPDIKNICYTLRSIIHDYLIFFKLSYSIIIIYEVYLLCLLL